MRLNHEEVLTPTPDLQASPEPPDEEFDKHFYNWYWSYAYGSKTCCIRYIERSDIPLEEKLKKIEYHKGNLGITKDV